MCEQCVRNGTMTKEELDFLNKDALILLSNIKSLLHNKQEEVIINVLLNCLISVTIDLDINPLQVIVSLINGFNIVDTKEKMN
jgi:hypothetical protein